MKNGQIVVAQKKQNGVVRLRRSQVGKDVFHQTLPLFNAVNGHAVGFAGHREARRPLLLIKVEHGESALEIGRALLRRAPGRVGERVGPMQRKAQFQVGARPVSDEIGLGRRFNLRQAPAARPWGRTTRDHQHDNYPPETTGHRILKLRQPVANVHFGTNFQGVPGALIRALCLESPQELRLVVILTNQGTPGGPRCAGRASSGTARARPRLHNAIAALETGKSPPPCLCSAGKGRAGLLPRW